MSLAVLTKRAHKRYAEGTLEDLQQLARQRGGNLRRDKSRRTCLNLLVDLDLGEGLDCTASSYLESAITPHEEMPLRYIRGQPWLLDYQGRNLSRTYGWHRCRFRCSVRELQNFIRQRSGDTNRNKCRATCVRELMLLDKYQTFRFLDLPAELRNMVYSMVLPIYNDEHRTYIRYHKSSRACLYNFPTATIAQHSLLRACKKINGEARGYLYDGLVSYAVSYQLNPRTSWSATQRGTRLPQVLDPLTTRPLIRNVTIFLLHFCALEKYQVARLVAQHTVHGPLRTLKIVLNRDCNAYKENESNAIAATEKLFHSLRGLVSTEVQFVGFSVLLESVARLAMSGSTRRASSSWRANMVRYRELQEGWCR